MIDFSEKPSALYYRKDLIALFSAEGKDWDYLAGHLKIRKLPGGGYRGRDLQAAIDGYKAPAKKLKPTTPARRGRKPAPKGDTPPRMIHGFDPTEVGLLAPDQAKAA